MSPGANAKTAEIERNFSHFIQLLPSLMAEHEGEYALLRDTGIIGFYPSAIDAQIAGNRRFPDHLFSIQLVKTTSEDLGYWSYATSKATMTAGLPSSALRSSTLRNTACTGSRRNPLSGR